MTSIVGIGAGIVIGDSSEVGGPSVGSAGSGGQVGQAAVDVGDERVEVHVEPEPAAIATGVPRLGEPGARALEVLGDARRVAAHAVDVRPRPA